MVVVLRKYFFKKKDLPKFVEVSNFNNFVTGRKNKGFGSTGV